MEFNAEKFKVENRHHPHFYQQKNNSEVMLNIDFAKPFKDGHCYRLAYIDEQTGEEIHVRKCGMFRRFSYNTFVSEAVKMCKEFAKAYETTQQNF